VKPGPSPNQHTPKAGSGAWPGWTDNPFGTCTCSWAVLGDVWQVKFANTSCPVRHKVRAS
jgi:hypothetical protein